MNYDEILKNIRLLSTNQQPTQDISELLSRHGCNFLLKKYQKFDAGSEALNKIFINERYKTCKNVFAAFEENNISYAVMKGAVLSKMAYGDAFCRKSGDIDLLMCRDDIDTAKQIMFDCGFVQGRVADQGIIPFNRKELLFQISASHQTAPFIKKTSNPVCPYVNVDVNLDIFWGESDRKYDMQDILKHTEPTEICGVNIRKLTPEMEFIALCLHHYKDTNSLYLLWQGNLNLSLFCDIYFYLKNTKLDLKILKELCNSLQANDHVYYCIYYANVIFDDSVLVSYMEALKTETAETILNTFGLAKDEVKTWNIGFLERLFSDNLKQYLESFLSPEDIHKIKINAELM